MINLIQGDCLEKMKDIADGFIDLTVTSPPYDNLRTYNGNNDQWGEHVWKDCIKELFRITKFGGVVVWVVGDATIKGSETGTSFKQALWAMECGFNLHDTMIYNKMSCPFPDTNRYYGIFEYMFIFTKGKIGKVNLIEDRKNKTSGEKIQGSTQRQKDGSLQKTSAEKNNVDRRIKPVGLRFNIWEIGCGQGKSHTDNYGHQHPASFPEQLAKDHIVSWSNKGDTVFDPFMGSGTTAKMSKLLMRNFIGIELDAEYFKLAQRRIAAVNAIPNEIDWGE